jgi:hypothetical protein
MKAKINKRAIKKSKRFHRKFIFMDLAFSTILDVPPDFKKCKAFYNKQQNKWCIKIRAKLRLGDKEVFKVISNKEFTFMVKNNLIVGPEQDLFKLLSIN